MEGLKVKCPNCKRTDFVTTDKYNPDVQPNGSMVKCLLPYHIDWLCSSATYAAQMTCPECTCQLAPYGRLTVIETVPNPNINVDGFLDVMDKLEAGTISDDEALKELNTESHETPVPGTEGNEAITPESVQKEVPLNEPVEEKQDVKSFACDVCGKPFGTKLALSGHKRSHK